MPQPPEMHKNIAKNTKPDHSGNEEISAGKIRAGIIGAGLMGRWHARAIERSGGEVIAVLDLDINNARKFGIRHPNAEAFDDLETMLSGSNVDVLHVCSPSGSHEDVANMAIDAGIHLLIEKPLAETAEATEQLYRRASENNTLICPVHQFPFQSGVKKAQKKLPEIGRLVHIEARICSAGGSGMNDEQITQIGNDILPHPLSLIQTFTDKGLASIEWNVSSTDAGELRILGKDEKGPSILIFISMSIRPTENSFHLYGTDGTISLDLFHGYSVVQPGKTSKFRKIVRPFDASARTFSFAAVNLAQRILQNEPAYPGLRRLIHEFYGAIANTGKMPITAEETLEIAKIRDMLISRSGKVSN